MPASSAISNILQLSHFDHLINFLATYPAIVEATSALFSSRTLSNAIISCVLGTKNVHNYVNTVLIFRCKILFPKVKFSLIKERHRKILSEFRTSRKLTRNLPPLICLYWEKRRSTGSFCSVTVITY